MYNYVEGVVDEVDSIALFISLPEAVYMPYYLLDSVSRKNVYDNYGRVYTLEVKTSRGRTTRIDEDYKFLRLWIGKLADSVLVLEVSYTDAKVTDAVPICCSREGGII